MRSWRRPLARARLSRGSWKCSWLDVALAQQLLVELSSGMAREIQLEINALGRLDLAEQLAAARLQRLGERGPRLPGLRRLDDGLDFLAEFLIGYAEHC